MIKPISSSRIDAVFEALDEPATYTKIKQILIDCLELGDWAKENHEIAETLISKSMEYSKTGLSLKKQWKIANLVEKASKNLENDLKLTIHQEMEIEVNACLIKSLSPVFKAMLEKDWIESRSKKPINLETEELAFLIKTPFEFSQNFGFSKTFNLLRTASAWGFDAKAYPIIKHLLTFLDDNSHFKLLKQLEDVKDEITKNIMDEIVHGILNDAIAKLPLWEKEGKSEFIKKLAAYLPRLKNLETDRLHLASHAAIKRVLQFLPEELHTLNLSHFSSKKLADLTLYPELKKFKSLRTLICRDCQSAYDVSNVKTLFPNLKELDISNCPKLKNVPPIPSLQKLTIYGKTPIMMQNLKRFFSLHQELSTLILKTDNKKFVDYFTRLGTLKGSIARSH